MSECKPIHGLKLDDHSLSVLENIRLNRRSFKALRKVLPIAVIVNATAQTTAPASIYSVHATEWEMAGEAIGSLSRIEIAQIKKNAELALFDYYTPQSAQERKLKQFWSNVYNLCHQEMKATK